LNGGCREIILGMAHRGRLNVQTHILENPAEEIFRSSKAATTPRIWWGPATSSITTATWPTCTSWRRHDQRVYLVNNPSHWRRWTPWWKGLPGPGRICWPDGDKAVLPVLLHGDAAFAGQGVVAETLNMSQLEGYRTGGTLHIIINNQIGYTTLPEDARSTRYSTDVAKMLMVPIFMSTGKNPEAWFTWPGWPADYRNRFGKDVVIDLVCYRRYGHNEGDEPYFTQPGPCTSASANVHP
jgi:2-oxoglutarate dehydrogenase E1 component